MFGRSDKDLAQFLMTAERQAIDRCHFNQTQAVNELARIISNDRRFDAYDPTRLADRVSRVRHSGAVLNMDDPELRHGGEAYISRAGSVSRSGY
jgi:hypothetical protein